MIRKPDLVKTRCNQCEDQRRKCSIPAYELDLIKRIGNPDIMFQELNTHKEKYKTGWIFRGQLSRHPLQTNLERAWQMTPGMKANDLLKAEQAMIREFQRRYIGENTREVRDSILFCLSLMQHHGAPTRLLDWTYSPYAALYFGLQYAHDTTENVMPFAVWCLDSIWCWDAAVQVCRVRKEDRGRNRVEARRSDVDRKTDVTFVNLYMPPQSPEVLVCPENPFYFHPRLLAQQGVFLCPGDVGKSFQENLLTLLKNANEGKNEGKLIKYCCPWNKILRQKALDTLRSMNIDRASLFPGLDGFGQSLKYRLEFFQDLGRYLDKPLTGGKA